MLERTAHWITATSSVVLALTGLNILYGRHVLLPVLGPEIFSAITLAGKYAHNFLAFAFMVGRSEEHTSELQSLMRISYAVFCLKKTNHIHEYQQKQKSKHHKNMSTHTTNNHTPTS